MRARPGKDRSYRDTRAIFSANTASRIGDFSHSYRAAKDYWLQQLHSARKQGQNIALWGGGSKASAFLSQIDQLDQIKYVVDVNPNKQGKYIPGGGQEVVPPDFLKTQKVDRIIAMNAAYRDEIAAKLQELGCEAELLLLR